METTLLELFVWTVRFVFVQGEAQAMLVLVVGIG